MRIEETWSYHATPDRVFEMLLDPRFQEAKCQATGALQHSVEITTAESSRVISLEREMSTEGLPDNVARLVGKTLQINEIQTWGPPDADGSRTADLEVALNGLPITYVGRITMRFADGETHMQVEGDLQARIPLFGKKVEAAAAPGIQEGVRIEAETGKDYLAG